MSFLTISRGMRAGGERANATIDSDWPVEEPEGWDEFSDESDGTPLELDDEHWDALVPDDDYEPAPEPGDFWPEQDTA